MEGKMTKLQAKFWVLKFVQLRAALVTTKTDTDCQFPFSGLATKVYVGFSTFGFSSHTWIAANLQITDTFWSPLVHFD